MWTVNESLFSQHTTISGDSDLNREFMLPITTAIGGEQNKLKLSEIIDKMKVSCPACVFLHFELFLFLIVHELIAIN